MENYDLLVIGGGPAGLAAACEAKRQGVQRILIVERDARLGGILPQCIHPGFGLELYQQELTGPEFALRLVQETLDLQIETALDTMVVKVEQLPGGGDGQGANPASGNPPFLGTLLKPGRGVVQIQCQAVVLAMGCRERTRGAIDIPGDRPSGIMTAGQAQRYINMEGLMIGRQVVILGSGDIGLIMARRLTLEGARVVCVAEVMPWSGGLRRNIVQCLDDFDIPLRLSTTVTDIQGNGRLSQVTLQRVDDKLKPIPGTEEVVACDTLLLSVGLIPENELSRELGVELSPRTNGPVVDQNMETSIPGVFAAGNVLHVHDLVDNVVKEAIKAGRDAAAYVLNTAGHGDKQAVAVIPGDGLTYALPQKIEITHHLEDETADLYFRVAETMEDVYITVKQGDRVILRRLKVFMTPGEMEKIRILLAGITSQGPVLIEVEN